MGLDYIETEINLYIFDFFSKSSPSVHIHGISFDLLRYSFIFLNNFIVLYIKIFTSLVRFILIYFIFQMLLSRALFSEFHFLFAIGSYEYKLFQKIVTLYSITLLNYLINSNDLPIEFVSHFIMIKRSILQNNVKNLKFYTNNNVPKHSYCKN